MGLHATNYPLVTWLRITTTNYHIVDHFLGVNYHKVEYIRWFEFISPKAQFMVVCLRRHRDTESPLRRCKPSPSTSPWPDVHLPNVLTIHLRQYITVYLVGSSMPTLDNWLIHLAASCNCKHASLSVFSFFDTSMYIHPALYLAF